MSQSHDDGVPRAPRRNRFFYGKMMGAPQFELEQRYGMDQRHLVQRLAVGSGVLCGLQVTADKGFLHVSPGVAIDGFGREIVVPEEATLDPWLLDGGDGPPLGRSKAAPARVLVKLCYDECEADCVPVAVATRCGTGERSEAGTIVETYRLVAEDYVEQASTTDSYGVPKSYAYGPAVVGKAGGAIAAKDIARLMAERRTCGIAADPCVPLAIVNLEEGGTIGSIDLGPRRELMSNAVLLDVVKYLMGRVEQLEAAIAASLRNKQGEDT